MKAYKSPQQIEAIDFEHDTTRRAGPSATTDARFYRAMQSIRGTSHGPVSVRLSVTSRCSIETAERIELVCGM